MTDEETRIEVDINPYGAIGQEISEIIKDEFDIVTATVESVSIDGKTGEGQATFVIQMSGDEIIRDLESRTVRVTRARDTSEEESDDG